MATTAVVAGTATAVSGAVAGKQHQKAAQQQMIAEQQAAEQQAQMQQAAEAAVAAAPAAATGGTDVVSQLKQLADLKAQGILSDAEFEAAKKKLLAG
jgi:hypothetical protein